MFSSIISIARFPLGFKIPVLPPPLPHIDAVILCFGANKKLALSNALDNQFLL